MDEAAGMDGEYSALLCGKQQGGQYGIAMYVQNEEFHLFIYFF